MRIVFAGGGTAGHFYPIIAIVEALREHAASTGAPDPECYFVSDDPLDSDLLKANNIHYINIPTGKVRTYASWKNFTDKFLIAIACLRSLVKLFVLYPDVVFGKGGYASFPAVFAAKMLRIPVMIHESDISPGSVNKYVADYATRIAVAYPETVEYFRHKDRVALTGVPIRKAFFIPPVEDPIATLGLERGIPTILVLGGSQGAERINEQIVDMLPRLVVFGQVIHQTGERNIEWIKKRSEAVLKENANAGRYHPVGFLDMNTLNLAAHSADIIISRSGSTIFEIAIWKKPSILIPLPLARGDHQRENAYSYARTGAAVVIEEQNMKSELLMSVITELLSNVAKRRAMSEATTTFAHPDAAAKIADALLAIGRKHGD